MLPRRQAIQQALGTAGRTRHCATMMRLVPGLAAFALLAGCMPAQPVAVDTARRPLDTQSGEARMADIEADLLATARSVYGDTALVRALNAPKHLVIKRFIGMAPPPPPGAGADWRPPTPSALLMEEGGRWYAATAAGWRPASAEPIAEIEALLASEEFQAEAATIPACPDYGASNLLVKVPGRARTVRSHQCSSATTRVIEAAFRA